MAINLMQGLLSAVLMQSRKLPGNTVIAGAALSAVTPGPIGLLLPLVIAPPPAAPPDDDPVTTLVAVPLLVGQAQGAAVKALEAIELVADIRPGKIADDDTPAPPGYVIAQQPQPEVAVPLGSSVVLFVQPPADDSGAKRRH